MMLYLSCGFPIHVEARQVGNLVSKYGTTTTFEIMQKYKISKQKTCFAIKQGKLLAFQTDVVKWFIIKDNNYNDFISKNCKSLKPYYFT